MFYYGFHLYILALCLFLDNDLKFQIQKAQFIFPLLFLVSIILSTLAYRSVAKRPGYISKAKTFHEDDRLPQIFEPYIKPRKIQPEFDTELGGHEEQAFQFKESPREEDEKGIEEL